MTFCSASGVEVISADTSYADPNDRLLGRGVSLAGVSILGPSLAVNHARIYGTLADGREHDAHLATLDGRGRQYDTPGDDEIIGTETQDGWWVKARAAPSAREARCAMHARAAPSKRRGASDRQTY